MDLVSRNAYWRIKNGVASDIPASSGGVRAEVVVVGAGISGAMISFELVRRGWDTVLLDRFDSGAGSTSGSTALIQYELDQTLGELVPRLGAENAERAYLASFRALDRIAEYARLAGGAEIAEKKSYYVAKRKSENPELIRECRRREKIGLPVSFISGEEFTRRFSFSRACALLSERAYELDPLALTHGLIGKSRAAGMRFYDRSPVREFRCDGTGVELRVGTDRIRAKHVVFATGYESAKYLPKRLFRLHSSYALVTKPLGSFEGWFERSQIWETARPYLYLRATADGRAMIGGMDVPFRNPELRDRLLPRKKERLAEVLREWFPAIDFEIAYAWCGTFGETVDSLPYIGAIPRYPGVTFACGFGGNGISFGAIAAELIPDLLDGKRSPETELFGFGRTSGK